MRILFVIDGLWVGGTERSVAELLPSLERLGVECEVACLRQRDEGVEEEVRRQGLTIHHLAGGSLFAQAWTLRRLVQRTRPDVVHSALFRADLVSRIALIGLDTVLVNSLVNTTYGPARLADPSLRRRRVRVAQVIDVVTGRLLVDHFHAVSEAAKAAATRDQLIPGERITIARRGRDSRRLGEPSDRRRAASRQALGIPAGALVLVNVARQDPQKGLVFLVDALARLGPRHPELLLLLVGRPGAASAELTRAIERHGVKERVRQVGHRDDVPDLLAASDVFVFPSLWEGYPGAVLEAMALGLPVVAADIPPTREILSPETGFLVPAEDSNALASSIEKLLEDPALRGRLGEAARRRFNEAHTIEASAQSMLALYESVVRRGAP